MATSEIETKVKGILASLLDCPVDSLRLEQTIIIDLGADSLTVVKIAQEIENEFGIEITDDEMEDCQTVAKMIALVEAKVAALKVF